MCHSGAHSYTASFSHHLFTRMPTIEVANQKYMTTACLRPCTISPVRVSACRYETMSRSSNHYKRYDSVASTLATITTVIPDAHTHLQERQAIWVISHSINTAQFHLGMLLARLFQSINHASFLQPSCSSFLPRKSFATQYHRQSSDTGTVYWPHLSTATGTGRYSPQTDTGPMCTTIACKHILAARHTVRRTRRPIAVQSPSHARCRASAAQHTRSKHLARESVFARERGRHVVDRQSR